MILNCLTWVVNASIVLVKPLGIASPKEYFLFVTIAFAILFVSIATPSFPFLSTETAGNVCKAPFLSTSTVIVLLLFSLKRVLTSSKNAAFLPLIPTILSPFTRPDA
ncbi:hypothetical protein D9M72_512860 [compost metagenome]